MPSSSFLTRVANSGHSTATGVSQHVEHQTQPAYLRPPPYESTTLIINYFETISFNGYNGRPFPFSFTTKRYFTCQHSMLKYFVVIASWADGAIVTHDERGRTTTSKTILNTMAGRCIHRVSRAVVVEYKSVQEFVGTVLWPNNALIYCECIKGCYAS